MIERRQDARRERRRAAALHEADEGVQVHATVAREQLRKLLVKAGIVQPRTPPSDDGRRFWSRGGRFSTL